jgi:hypothetical protein
MKTMLDKCAVAGDITQALDRQGVATVAITVIGGTESTAVKLQSCETADGSFTDFAELISASDASADQYKGFIVDLHGAGKFIKVVGATMATAVFGDCDYDVKKVTIKAGEIPSGADLENNKTATIDVSTYTEPVEITPTAGKDGMAKATVTLSNIPSGGGATGYGWSDNVQNRYWWFSFGASPTNKTAFENSKKLDFIATGSKVENVFVNSCADFFGVGASYTLTEVSYFQFIVTYEGQDITFTRDPTKDFTLWG